MEKVHFWTTGEYFTNLVRNFWKEYSFKTALECLQDLPINIKLDILEGRKKFIGGTYDDQTFEIVDDNQENKDILLIYIDNIINDYLSLLGLSDIYKYILDIEKHINNLYNIKDIIDLNTKYPNTIYLDKILELIINYKNILQDKNIEDKLKNDTENIELIEPIASIQKNENDINKLLNKLEWDDTILLKKLSIEQIQLLQITKSNIRSFDIDHITFQRELNNLRTDIKIENIYTTYWNSGYITYDGNFYGFPDRTHIIFAEKIIEKLILFEKEKTLLPERILEIRNWLKLSEGKIYFDDSNNYNINIDQYKAIYNWMINPINEKSINKDRILINDKYYTLQKIKNIINE